MLKGTKNPRAKLVSTEGQLSFDIVRKMLSTDKEQEFLKFLKRKRKLHEFCTNVTIDLNNYLRHPKKAVQEAIKYLPGTTLLSFMADQSTMLPKVHEYYSEMEDEYLRQIW